MLELVKKNGSKIKITSAMLNNFFAPKFIEPDMYFSAQYLYKLVEKFNNDGSLDEREAALFEIIDCTGYKELLNESSREDDEKLTAMFELAMKLQAKEVKLTEATISEKNVEKVISQIGTDIEKKYNKKVFEKEVTSQQEIPVVISELVKPEPKAINKTLYLTTEDTQGSLKILSTLFKKSINNQQQTEPTSGKYYKIQLNDENKIMDVEFIDETGCTESNSRKFYSDKKSTCNKLYSQDDQKRKVRQLQKVPERLYFQPHEKENWLQTTGRIALGVLTSLAIFSIPFMIYFAYKQYTAEKSAKCTNINITAENTKFKNPSKLINELNGVIKSSVKQQASNELNGVIQKSVEQQVSINKVTYSERARPNTFLVKEVHGNKHKKDEENFKTKKISQEDMLSEKKKLKKNQIKKKNKGNSK